ncbi:integration host factor subunit alpha [Bacillus phage vB_BcoS-136]|uniref:Integration host factor subunit alpha n=1 Tax=Bacillus phage vB_BcoS-136 TaxID=2419619 RepID=A0A3G3BVF6_9CAUD|nr:integration host factor subunit alpha [Bacillus phage vB_BcoS-136]AYP68239.1 integration host factor subunit alpha [Bacillus phage vB_BcoS-136]
MKLSDMIHRVWRDERVKDLGIRKSEVKVIVKVFIDHIVKELLTNKLVKIHGLFTLDIREAKGRKIRNPQTKEEMYIDDYYKIGLEPSKRLKEGLEDLRDK